ncbi:hypothetical protein ACA910_011916 [Epithemia clementina (nom. ined.)]
MHWSCCFVLSFVLASVIVVASGAPALAPSASPAGAPLPPAAPTDIDHSYKNLQGDEGTTISTESNLVTRELPQQHNWEERNDFPFLRTTTRLRDGHSVVGDFQGVRAATSRRLPNYSKASNVFRATKGKKTMTRGQNRPPFTTRTAGGQSRKSCSFVRKPRSLRGGKKAGKSGKSTSSRNSNVKGRGSSKGFRAASDDPCVFVMMPPSPKKRGPGTSGKKHMFNDPCLVSNDPCCGSDDPCCGDADPCCGSLDPLCGDEILNPISWLNMSCEISGVGGECLPPDQCTSGLPAMSAHGCPGGDGVSCCLSSTVVCVVPVGDAGQCQTNCTAGREAEGRDLCPDGMFCCIDDEECLTECCSDSDCSLGYVCSNETLVCVCDEQCCDDDSCGDAARFECVDFSCRQRDCNLTLVDTDCCEDSDCGTANELVCVESTCVNSGSPRFTLSWFGDDDLDLHVITPGGFEIDYRSTYDPTSQGRLDQDDIPGPITRWVENIYFPLDGSSPRGTYTYFVHYYSQIGIADSWQLFVYIGDERVRLHNGSPLQNDRYSYSTRFNYTYTT